MRDGGKVRRAEKQRRAAGAVSSRGGIGRETSVTGAGCRVGNGAGGGNGEAGKGKTLAGGCAEPDRNGDDEETGRKAKSKGTAPGSSGRVQQRMERMFGAITLSNRATLPPRLNPFRSFGG